MPAVASSYLSRRPGNRAAALILAALSAAGFLLATAGCHDTAADVDGAGSAAFQQQHEREQRVHDENQIIDDMGKH